MSIPIISISRVDVVESGPYGHHGPAAVFQVQLSQAGTQDLTVFFRSWIGTAAESDIYDNWGSGMLTISAGDTSGTIVIETAGDSVDEADESFWIELYGPQNGVLAGGENTLRALGVIRDDDGGGANLALFVSSPKLVEGDSGTKTAVFEVHLSRPHGSNLTFNYTTADGSAKAGSDYIAKSGTVTFLAGQTIASVEVSVKGDTTAELTEFFSLVVTPTGDIANGTAASTGVATVLDDDGGGSLPSITISRVDVVESGPYGHHGPNATFQVQLSHAASQDVTMTFRSWIGTAAESDIYDNWGSGTLTIMAGQTTAHIIVEVAGDAVDEVDESFWLELYNPQNAVLAGGENTLRALGVIRDDDGGGTNLALFVSSPKLAEGHSGNKTAVFEVHLSRPHGTNLTFNYTTADGSAKAGSDYVGKAGTVTFLAGQTMASIEVAVIGNSTPELTEFFSLVVTPTGEIANGTAASTGVATILDDDSGGSRPSISISRVDVVESGPYGHHGPYADFQVQLSHAATQDVTVSFRSLIGTADESDIYDDWGSGTLTILAGRTTGHIVIEVAGDSLDELDESFWMELHSPQNAVLAGGESTLRALGVIRDDDGGGTNLALFVSSPKVVEGHSGTKTAVFEVHLSRPHGATLTMNYTTADGTAKAGSDYVAKSGTVTFLAGQTVASVEVAVNGDRIVESDETFSLVVTPAPAIANSSVAHAGTATIANDDAPRPPTGLTLSKSTLAENAGANALVGVLSGTDPDGNSGLTYSIAKDADGKFVVVGNQLRAKQSLDFEAKSAHVVRLKVTDPTGLSYEKNFTIAVTNVNDAPTGITLSRSAIAENLKPGTAVGTLSIVDAEGTAGAKYKLTSSAGGLFKLSGNTLLTNKRLNFEKQPSHKVTVEATDAGGRKIVKAFTIGVEDVVDVISGTSKKDTLTGARGADDIRGLGGNDKLFGKGGHDTLAGGDGNDTLVGGTGADKLNGGRGADTASYEDAGTAVIVNLKKPAANYGEAKGDTYSSIENLTGSAFNDALTGDNGANILKGGKGKDKLEGGRGGDLSYGGGGADLFVFKGVGDSKPSAVGRDVIADFSQAQGDRIDVSAIDAKVSSKKSNQKFTFIEKRAFSGAEGELRYDQSGGKTFVYGDVTGDGVADFQIELLGTIALRKADFVL